MKRKAKNTYKCVLKRRKKSTLQLKNTDLDILAANPELLKPGFETEVAKWNRLLEEARAKGLPPAEQAKYITERMK